MSTVLKVVVFLLVLLVLLNPTNNDFDNYTRAKDFRTINDGLAYAHGGRISYCLIFSLFEINTIQKTDGWRAKNRRRVYVGVLKNFFLIEQTNKPVRVEEKF